MDPNITWRWYLEAIADNKVEAGVDHLSILSAWLLKGGFLPTGVPHQACVHNLLNVHRQAEMDSEDVRERFSDVQ